MHETFSFRAADDWYCPSLVWQRASSSLSGGDLYSAILLHNGFAVRGVVQALDQSGSLDRYGTPQLPLIITAITAALVLVAADVTLIRPLVRRDQRRSARRP
jgi:hypothetical protein